MSLFRAFRYLAVFLCLSCVTGVASVSNAEMIPGSPPATLPALEIFLDLPGQGHGPPANLSPPGLAIAQNKFRYQGSYTHGPFSIEWDIEADPDPFLSHFFTITNNLPIEQEIHLSVTLPIDPIIGVGTWTGGSFSGNLIDSGGGGAQLTKFSGGSPPPMYLAIIDGVDFYPMDFTSLPITTIPFGTIPFGPEEFGVPIPSHPGPNSVLTSIGIETNVRISGNDTAYLVATFVVEPVPEPSSIALLLMASVGLLIYIRRR